MIKALITLFGLCVFGAAIADPAEDEIAQHCFGIIRDHNAGNIESVRSSKELLNRCYAINACQNPILADVPGCALKLNTWVFNLSVPQPPSGSKLSAPKSVFQSGAPAQDTPPANQQSLQFPVDDSSQNGDKQPEQGINWR